MLEALVYIAFCLLTGLCGVERRMGFFGTFLLALVTTPLLVLPILFITGPSRRVLRRRAEADGLDRVGDPVPR
ncbi:MAG TPA: hypothetical protein VGI09_12850 [Pseudolabrys sp.]|jgi:hypothetical protein